MGIDQNNIHFVSLNGIEVYIHNINENTIGSNGSERIKNYLLELKNKSSEVKFDYCQLIIGDNEITNDIDMSNYTKEFITVLYGISEKTHIRWFGDQNSFHNKLLSLPNLSDVRSKITKNKNSINFLTNYTEMIDFNVLHENENSIGLLNIYLMDDKTYSLEKIRTFITERCNGPEAFWKRVFSNPNFQPIIDWVLNQTKYLEEINTYLPSYAKNKNSVRFF